MHSPEWCMFFVNEHNKRAFIHRWYRKPSLEEVLFAIQSSGAVLTESVKIEKAKQFYDLPGVKLLGTYSAKGKATSIWNDEQYNIIGIEFYVLSSRLVSWFNRPNVWRFSCPLQTRENWLKWEASGKKMEVEAENAEADIPNDVCF